MANSENLNDIDVANDISEYVEYAVKLPNKIDHVATLCTASKKNRRPYRVSFTSDQS